MAVQPSREFMATLWAYIEEALYYSKTSEESPLSEEGADHIANALLGLTIHELLHMLAVMENVLCRLNLVVSMDEVITVKVDPLEGGLN